MLNNEQKKIIADFLKSMENSPIFKKEIKKEAPKRRTLPKGYIGCKWGDLLKEIKYDPNGGFSKENNALWEWSEDGKCYWYCSDKKVGILRADGKIVVIAPNAFERLKTSIARKWSFERDWIPTYKYTQEDNEGWVGVTIQEGIKNGDDTSEIISACFRKLDQVSNAEKPDRTTTLPKEENVRDADRYMLALLLLGSEEYLTTITSDDGETELDLPDESALEDYSEYELKRFEDVKALFDTIKEKHEAASFETWYSALLHILQVPTRKAVERIYGKKGLGVKKYRRCEVAYSRSWKEFCGWLSEEIKNIAEDEKKARRYKKWVAAIEAI